MRKLICIVLALTVVLFCVACSSKPPLPTDSSPNAASQTDPSSIANSDASSDADSSGSTTPVVETLPQYDVLNVGVLVSTVGIPALYAQDQGWFEEVGLNVNILTFPTGAPVNEAIAADSLDIACSGFASVYSLANADCKWLLDINTTGGMGVFAREGSPVIAAGNTLPGYPNILGSVDTIRGLQILGPVGTAVQYMVEGYADKFGLTPDQISMVNMEYAPAYQAYVAGEGDLNATNPPTSYRMADEGYALVCSFEDATGVSLMDGCFVRREISEKRGDEVQLFVDVLVRAMDALQDKDTRFEYTIQKYHENAQEFSEETLLREFGDRDYMGTGFVTANGYIFGEAWGAITDFLVSAERITTENAPNVAASLEPSYLEKTTGASIAKFQ